MAYGQGDEIQAWKNAYEKALEALIDVALGKKGVKEVRTWLEENEPQRCQVAQPSKKIWEENRKGKWPPLDPGTIVKTTQPNLEKRREWTDEGWARKKWGVQGPIVTHHDSHGLCYDVQHPDGTVGCYDPSELETI